MVKDERANEERKRTATSKRPRKGQNEVVISLLNWELPAHMRFVTVYKASATLPLCESVCYS